MLAAKSQKNNGIPYSLTQRNWECQAGMECIMHPGKELGQCVDIDECTASILHSTPCIVLLKYCRSSHHQRSFETPFAGSALYWCFAGILWSKHNVHKQVQLIKHFLCFQTKGIHCYEKKSQTKVPTILTFEALARSRALATQDSPVSKERSQVLSALLSWCQTAILRKKFPWTS